MPRHKNEPVYCKDCIYGKKQSIGLNTCFNRAVTWLQTKDKSWGDPDHEAFCCLQNEKNNCKYFVKKIYYQKERHKIKLPELEDILMGICVIALIITGIVVASMICAIHGMLF